MNPPTDPLETYPYHVAITTRWSDNDLYGHINNVIYYSYFDTAANRYLIEHGGLDIFASPVVGVVVESKCNYHFPLCYPEELTAGVRVDRLGDRSVTYGIGIFRPGTERPAANGHFVHVFVERKSGRPVLIPDGIRAALERIRVD